MFAMPGQRSHSKKGYNLKEKIAQKRPIINIDVFFFFNLSESLIFIEKHVFSLFCLNLRQSFCS